MQKKALERSLRRQDNLHMNINAWMQNGNEATVEQYNTFPVYSGKEEASFRLLHIIPLEAAAKAESEVLELEQPLSYIPDQSFSCYSPLEGDGMVQVYVWAGHHFSHAQGKVENDRECSFLCFSQKLPSKNGKPVLQSVSDAITDPSRRELFQHSFGFGNLVSCE